MQLHVLELLPTPQRDAVGRVASALASSLPSSSFHVDISYIGEGHPTFPARISTATPLFDQPTESTVRLLVSALTFSWRNGLTILHTHLFRPVVPAFFGRLRRPDVIWCHTEHNLGPRVGLAASMIGRWFHRLALRHADAVIAVSDPVAQRFPSPPYRTSVIPNGVPGPSQPPPLPLADGRQDITVGFAGRLSSEKGLEPLLEAFSSLDPTRVRLLVAGDGPLRPLVRAAPPTVQYIGFVDDISDFLARVDFLILPSFTEGLPLILLESLAHGRPVLATPVGGIPMVLEKDLPQWLLPDNNPKTIRDAVLHAVANPGHILSASATARMIWENGFSVQRMVARYAHCFRALLDIRSRRPVARGS